MTESQEHTEGATTTRRAVLAGAGAIGAAALLAACGSDDDASSKEASATPAAASPTSSASPASPPPPTAPPTAPSTSASGGGTRLAAVNDIPVGGGKVFPAQQAVVTRPATGTFKGFTATCTHMACTVADVRDGTINCACHGSKFSIEDGAVEKGPASRPLSSVAVSVRGNDIWLS